MESNKNNDIHSIDKSYQLSNDVAAAVSVEAKSIRC